MITVVTRYNTANVDSYYNHLKDNVINESTKQYIDDVLPIFSGAEDFNAVSAGGGIHLVEVSKTETYVDLKIVWNDSSQWLSFVKTHLDTANGLSTQHKFLRSNYSGDVFYTADTDAEQAHLDEYFSYVCTTMDAKDDTDETKHYATLPSTHKRYQVPESGW